MTPDYIEAAAVECLALADALEAGGRVTDRFLCHVAEQIVRVPIVHPMREHVNDGVLAMAEMVRRNHASPDDLLAFVDALRAGGPAMRERGWYPTMRGAA